MEEENGGMNGRGTNLMVAERVNERVQDAHVDECGLYSAGIASYSAGIVSYSAGIVSYSAGIMFLS